MKVMRNKKKIIIISLSLLVIFTLIYIPIRIVASLDRVIAKEVYVQGEDLGLESKEYALSSLDDKFNQNFQRKKLTLKYGETSITKTYADLGARYNVEDAVESAFAYGKNKNPITRIIKNIKPERHDISLEIVYDQSLIDKLIPEVSEKVFKKPVDAELKFKNNKFTVKEEKLGYEVDTKKLKELIEEAILKEKEVVDIPVLSIKPSVDKELLSKVGHKLSSMTTSYASSEPNRKSNIRLGAKYVNGALILPGEVFSFKEAIGEITYKRGFLDAPIFSGGKVIPGVGGGVCQISSTLYNAVLYANLEIVQRSNHAFAVGYVSPGRDATISGSGPDFKFRNNLKYPIYVEVLADNSKVTVNIYGCNENPGQRVELYTKTVKSGEKTRYKTYRRIYQNNKLVKTEYLSNDYYKPHP